MTAESMLEAGLARRASVSAAAGFGRWAAGTLVGLLAAAALVVVWRRLAGALSDPLNTPALLAAGFSASAAAMAVRLAWHAAATAPAARWNRTARWLPTVSMLVLGLALSLPGSPPAGLAGLWAVLAVEECWAWRAFRRRRAEPLGRRPRLDPPAKQVPHGLPPHADPATPPGETVLQQLTRSRTADGSEQLSGWLRAPFSAGQRTASVHVAFCPPFGKMPELAVEQAGGPEARVKTAQLLPYGARLELKLAAPAEAPSSVVLQLQVRAKG